MDDISDENQATKRRSSRRGVSVAVSYEEIDDDFGASDDRPRKGRGRGGKKESKSNSQVVTRIRRIEIEWGDQIPESFQEFDSFVGNIETQLNVNAQSEPYYGGAWKKVPYARRPYEEITDYIPAPDMSQESLDILNTTKTAACNHDAECLKRPEYSLADLRFVTENPCQRNNIGCSVSDIANNRRLNLGEEIEIADMWGLDCFTRRNIQSVLELCTKITSEEEQGMFIQRILVPTINFQPAHRSHDICFSLRTILMVLGDQELERFQTDDPEVQKNVKILIVKNTTLDEATIRVGARSLLFAAHRFDLENFRVIPKGAGVRCILEGGLEPGRFVTKYLGELYTPWRWFEKQDCIKNAQRKFDFKPVLPDFYNIMLERHQDDEAGYDVAFIDPIARGNFASRLSHSCDPNCVNVVMVVEGKYVVALYTLKHIAYGEELSFDYSSVTEDKNEFLAATCLCYSLKCRGSFLGWAGAGAFEDVAKQYQTFLDRNALIFHACKTKQLTDSEKDRLTKYGIKSSLLHELPVWLAKWSSLVLEYAEFEMAQLPAKLIAKLHPATKQPLYDVKSAELESRGVFENRKQNVAITLSKIRRFLLAACNGESLRDIASPFRILSEKEVVSNLCDVKRPDEAILLRLINRVIALSDGITRAEELMAIKDMLSNVSNIDQARTILRKLRSIVWSINNKSCEAAGDLLTWILYTDHFFTSNAYPGGCSPEIHIRNIDIGKDGSVADSTKPPPKTKGSDAKVAKDNSNTGETFRLRVQKTCDINETTTFWDGSTTSTVAGYQIQVRVYPAPFWYFVTEGEVTFLGVSADKLLPLALDIRGGVVENISRDLSVSTNHMRFLAQPMSGCEAFYAFVRPGLPCRIAKEPSISLDGKQTWHSEFLFYAFETCRPGTTRVRVADASGKPCDIYAFDASTVIHFSSDNAIESPMRKKAGRSDRNTVDPMKVVHTEKKKYQSGFVWGQLSGWFKQSVAAPDASLSAERRGTLSLPDVESCFMDNTYKDRLVTLQRTHDAPYVMWPIGTNWRFKNSLRMYGSPWFDEALDASLAKNRYQAIADIQYHMKHRQAPPDEKSATLEKLASTKKTNTTSVTVWRTCTRACCKK